jgi:hypothetical protein
MFVYNPKNISTKDYVSFNVIYIGMDDIGEEIMVERDTKYQQILWSWDPNVYIARAENKKGVIYLIRPGFRRVVFASVSVIFVFAEFENFTIIKTTTHKYKAGGTIWIEKYHPTLFLICNKQHKEIVYIKHSRYSPPYWIRNM